MAGELADAAASVLLGTQPNIRSVEFTLPSAATVWTIPPGVRMIWLDGQAPGGGGGGGRVGGGGGGGGGAGNFCHQFPLMIPEGIATLTIQIGVPGLGGAADTDGTSAGILVGGAAAPAGGVVEIRVPNGTRLFQLAGGFGGQAGLVAGAGVNGGQGRSSAWSYLVSAGGTGSGNAPAISLGNDNQFKNMAGLMLGGMGGGGGGLNGGVAGAGAAGGYGHVGSGNAGGGAAVGAIAGGGGGGVGMSPLYHGTTFTWGAGGSNAAGATATARGLGGGGGATGFAGGSGGPAFLRITY
jgi:hypothetical protein